MGIRLRHLRLRVLAVIIFVSIVGIGLLLKRTITDVTDPLHTGRTAPDIDMAAALKVLTVAPITKHTATVIFVHGLGDSGWGWKPVAEMLQDNKELEHIKWVLPHA